MAKAMTFGTKRSHTTEVTHASRPLTDRNVSKQALTAFGIERSVRLKVDAPLLGSENRMKCYRAWAVACQFGILARVPAKPTTTTEESQPVWATPRRRTC
jgi:hypothetical protein